MTSYCTTLPERRENRPRNYWLSDIGNDLALMCCNYQLGQAATEEDKKNIQKFLDYIENARIGYLSTLKSFRKESLGFSQDELDNLSKYNKMKDIAREIGLHPKAILSTLEGVLRKIDKQEQVGIESLGLASKMFEKIAERAVRYSPAFS